MYQMGALFSPFRGRQGYQLVVHRKDQLHIVWKRVVETDHGQLDDVGCGTLDETIDGLPLGLATKTTIG